MVAVDILTGYLGAGKTTLLRHALAHGLDGRRVAVVVNELGEVGIDGTVLAAPAGIDALVELTSDCLCCSIDEQRFDRAIVDLVDRTGAELVVVETTGVADPGPIGDRLRRLGFGIDAVTAVVDVGAIEAQLRTEPVVARQVLAADFLVLAKGDLASPARARGAARRLGRLNPRATRLSAVRGQVDPSLLFATGVRAWRSAPAAGARPAHAGVEAFVFRTPEPVDVERFEAVLRVLPPGVVRAKGVLRVSGSDAHCVFNYASGRRELSWLRLPGVSESQAVFIGRNVWAYEGAVRAALGACVRPEDGASAAG
jgi:cobalamin biosynthesis protein CobW